MMKSKPLEASQLVRGRGRPPKDPTKGMRQNCTFRLPENTRNKLLLAAVASNRSLRPAYAMEERNAEDETEG
jgi:hypothetical protein